MTSETAPRRKRKKSKHQGASRLVRAGFYLNALLFVLLVTGLMYHTIGMIYYHGLAGLNWTDFVMLAGGHALLLTWHYRLVFLRVYRALDGLYTHLFVFAGVMGFVWHEFFMFPEIRGNTLQDRLIVMAVWLLVLLAHALRVRGQSRQTSAEHDHTAAVRHTTQPDTSRLIDRTDTPLSAVHSVPSTEKTHSQQTG